MYVKGISSFSDKMLKFESWNFKVVQELFNTDGELEVHGVTKISFVKTQT